MAKKLVIVESPSKAKTIKKYLGKDFEVTASMGHVRDLPAAKLSVDVKNDFTPKYAIIKNKEKLVKELKAQVEKSEKSRRSREMIAATKQSEEEFLSKMIGKTCSVLFETKDKDGYYHGFTKNYCQVKIKTNKDITGKILDIKIIERNNNILIGEI